MPSAYFLPTWLKGEAREGACLHGLLYEAGNMAAVCRVYELLEAEGSRRRRQWPVSTELCASSPMLEDVRNGPSQFR